MHWYIGNTVNFENFLYSYIEMFCVIYLNYHIVCPPIMSYKLSGVNPIY